jgi:hypothetical protein
MSYVRIVDIEISKEDALYKLNDVLERRINAVLSSEHPIAATDIKILSVEDGLFGMTKYKVLILFG